MSRLFYDPPQLTQQAPGMAFIVRKARSNTKQYLEKVAKLVPSEVVAGYITMIGFVPLVKQEAIRPWIYLTVFLLCLILTPIYLNAQAITGKPKWIHLIVSIVAFIVWAYSVSGHVALPCVYHPAIASIILVAFSLISGIVPLNR